MILTGLAATLMLAQPSPVHVYRSHDVATALEAGCKVQHVFAPAGKIVSHRAIIRCPEPVAALADEPQRETPLTAPGFRKTHY